jgi:excisionase family DNA binding protein
MHQKLPPYMRPSDAREYGIGTAAWYRLIHIGEIKAIRVGRKLIVPRAAFLAWYNSAGGQIATEANGAQLLP